MARRRWQPWLLEYHRLFADLGFFPRERDRKPGRRKLRPPSCTCYNNCGTDVTSPDSFDKSYGATSRGVNVVDGTVITSVGVLGFQSRMLGFNMAMHHHSLTSYSGPYGEAASHTYNMHVVQSSATTAQVIAPALRVFDLNHDTGSDWQYISGFIGNWTRDPDLGRWLFTHHSGAVFAPVARYL